LIRGISEEIFFYLYIFS